MSDLTDIKKLDMEMIQKEIESFYRHDKEFEDVVYDDPKEDDRERIHHLVEVMNSASITPIDLDVIEGKLAALAVINALNDAVPAICRFYNGYHKLAKAANK